MAESSLSLGFPDFQKLVGNYLGYAILPANWTADQTTLVDDLIQAGYRQFLFPPRTEGQTEMHVWSFLRPQATLALVAGTADYTLPDNFGSLHRNFFYQDSSLHVSIQETDYATILRRRAVNSSLSAKATLFALRPVASTGLTGQRWQVSFWPEPDSTETIFYQYNVLTDKLTTALPFPLGGMAHAETLRESIIAMAELHANDELGIHNQKFSQLLDTSVSFDRSQMAPQTLGQNIDRSDLSNAFFGSNHIVTVNGSVP